MKNKGKSQIQSRQRLILISIDSAEVTRIESWMAEGSLPVLRSLRERGLFARMDSTADLLVGTPWPTFLTGMLPPEHGWLFFRQWRPDLMRNIRTGPSWLPIEPFYRQLPMEGSRTIAIDVPNVYAPRPFNGVELAGWGNHDQLFAPASFPQNLGREIRHRFGGPPMTAEISGHQSPNKLLRLRDELIRAADWHANVSIHLMENESWDLFLLAFGNVHRAGHKLWDHTTVSGPMTENQRDELDDALRQVTIATDRAIGRILKTADPSIPIFVFSLHGMTESYSAFHLLRRMLSRVLRGEFRDDPLQPPSRGPLAMLRETLPVALRSKIKSSLPLCVQDSVADFWVEENRDWSSTRAFPLSGDLEGLIQVNLRGRERDGIVEPGVEFDQLISEISNGLKSFVRIDTGQPLVTAVHRGEQVWPEATRCRLLPDLIVKTDEHSTLRLPGVRSPVFGTVVNHSCGHRYDWRSGHHLGGGWFVAVGNDIPAGMVIPRVHELDLSATIQTLIGSKHLHHPAHGKPIRELSPC